MMSAHRAPPPTGYAPSANHSRCTREINTAAGALLCCSSKTHNMGKHETLFNGIISTLFLEGALPDGAVVDAGAHTGENACLYSQLAPQRRVLAVEPIQANILAINARRLPNVRSLHAGLVCALSSCTPTLT